MTETERRADHAWRMMTRTTHAMPADIALDYAQEPTGERHRALVALLSCGINSVMRERPTLPTLDVFREGTNDMALLLTRREWNAADYECQGMRIGIELERRNLDQDEDSPLTLVDCELWLSWLRRVKHAIELCRQLEGAK